MFYDSFEWRESNTSLSSNRPERPRATSVKPVLMAAEIMNDFDDQGESFQ